MHTASDGSHEHTNSEYSDPKDTESKLDPAPEAHGKGLQRE